NQAARRTAQRAILAVTLVGAPLKEKTQGSGLAGPGRAGDEGKAAFTSELLPPPAEGLSARCDMQSLDGHVRGKRVPLEAIEDKMLVGHDASPSSWGRSALGR